MVFEVTRLRLHTETYTGKDKHEGRQVDTKGDNKDVQLLKEELWQQRTMAEIMMIKKKTVEENNILKEIRRNIIREREVIQALEKKDSLTWKEDGIVYMDGRIYVLNNKKIKEIILKENHDEINIGHPEQHRMMELVKRIYWWPGLKKDVKNYIQECLKCQQNKIQHQKRAGELHPLEIP